MEFREALDVFKNPAVVLAGLGSLFTRRPLTTAMNAAAEAMNGYQQGQEDTFKLKQKEWEDSTKAALEQNNIELEKYKEAWDLHDRNASEAFAKLYAQAAGNDDPTMKAAVQSGKFDIVEKLIMMREQAKTGFEKSLNLQEAKNKATQQQVSDLMQDPGVQATARAIRKYELAPLTGYALRSPYGQAVMNNVNSMPGPDAEYDAAKWQGKLSATRTAASAEPRADAQALKSVVSMVNSIESYQKTAALNGKKLVELADKVDTTGRPVFERWIRAGRRAVQGDPDVSEFNAQLALYVPEVAKIMNNPNLSGQLTDAARSDVQAILDQNASAAQIERVVKLFESDFGRRLGPLKEQEQKIREDLRRDNPTSQATPTQTDDGWGNLRVH
jgi:hypothetical protein